MEDRKLTQAHFEHGSSREMFSRMQHKAGLTPEGRARVDEAMKAAVAHVEKDRGLQYGMQAQHIDKALKFLDEHYEGRRDLKPHEKRVIEESFNRHFGIEEPRALDIGKE